MSFTTNADVVSVYFAMARAVQHLAHAFAGRRLLNVPEDSYCKVPSAVKILDTFEITE